MISERRFGTRDLWNVFDDKNSPLGQMLGFGGAVFRSAQNEAAKQTIDDLLAFTARLEALTEVCRASDHNGEHCTRPFCGGPRPRIEIAGRARM